MRNNALCGQRPHDQPFPQQQQLQQRQQPSVNGRLSVARLLSCGSLVFHLLASNTLWCCAAVRSSFVREQVSLHVRLRVQLRFRSLVRDQRRNTPHVATRVADHVAARVAILMLPCPPSSSPTLMTTMALTTTIRQQRQQPRHTTVEFCILDPHVPHRRATLVHSPAALIVLH